MKRHAATALALALLASAGAPAAVRAQDPRLTLLPTFGRTDPRPRRLSAGDTVRLSATGLRLHGVISRISADSLVLRIGGEERALPLGEVEGVARFAGRGSRGHAMLRGAAVGALAGGGLGALVSGQSKTLASCAPDPAAAAASAGCVTPPDPTLHAALIAEGVILGGLVGLMTGPALRGTRWEPLQEGELPLALVVQPQTHALALQLRIR